MYPDSRVQEAVLDGRVVLFHPVRDHYVVLDEEARSVWERLRRGDPAENDAVAAELASLGLVAELASLRVADGAVEARPRSQPLRALGAAALYALFVGAGVVVGAGKAWAVRGGGGYGSLPF